MNVADKISSLLDEAAKLAAIEYGDMDIFNYGRAYEYLMASTLGHTVCTTRSGSDGQDNEGTYEYKSTAYKGYNRNGELKNHSFNYFGFSRFDKFEDQVEYSTKKIMKDNAHYLGVKKECGFEFEAVFRVESKDILEVFLSKLEKTFYKVTKDPRINITITLSDLGDKVVRVK